MRTDLDPAVVTAYSQRAVQVAWFVWIIGRDRETSAPSPVGFWSGNDDRLADVISGETMAPATRAYHGKGAILAIDGIGSRIGLTARSVRVRLSQVHPQVQLAIRGYDPTQARIEIARGVFDPGTNSLLDYPRPRFLGFVDEAPIRTPPEGAEGQVELICQSHSREGTRNSAETRSDESQRRRDPTDGFYKYASVAAEFAPFWGEYDTRAGSGGQG